MARDLAPTGAGGRKTRTDRLAEISLFVSIWQQSWPIIGMMTLNFLVGYTDIYVAGLLGPEIQAAVGFVSQQFFLLIILGNALAIGTVALVSRANGRQDSARVLTLTRQTLILAVTLGLVLMVATYFGAGAILGRFSLPAPVRPVAFRYLEIFAFALLPNYVLILLNGVFRAVGKPIISLQVMGVVTAINVVGDFVLVFGAGSIPAMGYSGIACSTVLALVVGVGCAVGFLLQGPWRTLWRGPWRFSGSTILAIVGIGWPAVILQLAWNAGVLALYHFLGKLGNDSVTAMAAYSNGLRLESLIFLPAFALNMAAAVLVGQSLGRGDSSRARQYGWQMAGIGALALSLVAAAIYWAAPAFAALLSQDAAVQLETIRYLRINLPVVPFMVFSVVLGGAMQGAGDTFGVMGIIVVAIWLVRIPLAGFLCLQMDWGAPGVWMAMVISMAIQGILMIRRFGSGRWAQKASPDLTT